jgi:D-beta-D-heptose 7-phosphate kinase/D-beta-D-heptose 1-phosphate adenosyltransferase
VTNNASPIIARFRGKRVLVVGDLMLDEYLWGDVNRISQEAPVPVVRLTRSSLAAGGASNVAANVLALGGEPLLHGMVGDDADAQRLLDVLAAQGIRTEGVQRDPSRPTTIKTRIIAHAQQVVRTDKEDDSPLHGDREAALLQSLLAALEGADAVVLSDYAKGVLTQRLVKELLQRTAASGLPSVVDPACGDVARYQPVSMLKLNFQEAVAACSEPAPRGAGNNPEHAVRMGRHLTGRLDAACVAITCGPQGMVVVESGGGEYHIGASGREVYDVTGAGDTVTATLALALAVGADYATAARLSNQAAGIVVGKFGTAVVSAEELAAVAKEPC